MVDRDPRVLVAALVHLLERDGVTTALLAWRGRGGRGLGGGGPKVR